MDTTRFERQISLLGSRTSKLIHRRIEHRLIYNGAPYCRSHWEMTKSYHSHGCLDAAAVFPQRAFIPPSCSCRFQDRRPSFPLRLPCRYTKPSSREHQHEDRYLICGCFGLGAECFGALYFPAAHCWLDQVSRVSVHSTKLEL